MNSPTHPRIAIAVDKFKGTLSSLEAAGIIADIISDQIPDITVDCYPVADGGEGTANAVMQTMNMSTAVLSDGLTDAYLRPLPKINYAISADRREAVIDSSACVGLTNIPISLRHPLSATSYSLGVAIKRILASDIEHIHIGIGGTACCDGGVGMLQALGTLFYDHSHHLITSPIRACDIPSISHADFSSVDNLRSHLSAHCDVKLPLLSHDGMDALSFAPQKGATSDNIKELRQILHHWQAITAACRPDAPKAPFGGAGGGLGFAFSTAIGCNVDSGSHWIIDMMPDMFAPDVAAIITGEGCLDDQTMQGKAVAEILRQAQLHSIPVIAIGGCISPSFSSYDSFFRVIPTSDYHPDRLISHDDAAFNLSQAATRLISDLKELAHITRSKLDT